MTPCAAQVTAQSTQGIATLTVLSTGLGKNAQGGVIDAPTTNDSGYVSGQALQWVATYQQLALSSIATQEHVLSFGGSADSPVSQSYVQGSTQAPPGFSKEWDIGRGSATDWSRTEPADGTLIKGVRYSYAPNVRFPTTRTVNFFGTGDGYRVIPFTLKIGDEDVDALFMLNHHSGSGYLKCKLASSGEDCPTWSKAGLNVPKTSGKALSTEAVDSVWIPVMPTEYLDRKTGKLYFPVGTRGDDVSPTSLRDVGVMCADLVNKVSCGFTVTGQAASKGAHVRINGLGVTDDRRLLFFSDAVLTGQSRVHCFDLDTQRPCAGQPYAHNPVTPEFADGQVQRGKAWWSVWSMSAFTYGDHTFMSYPVEGAAGSYLSCFNNRTKQSCAGFGIHKTSYTPSDTSTGTHVPLPILDKSGTLEMVCLAGTGRAHRGVCRDLNGSAHQVAPTTDLGKWIAYPPFKSGEAIQTYVTSAKKAYTFDGNSNRIICYDFAKPGLCFEPDRQGVIDTGLPPDGKSPAFYAITEDPERIGCVWALGDASIGVVWNEATGDRCAQRVFTKTIDTRPSDYYGFDRTVNGGIAYQKVVVRNLGKNFVDTATNKGVRATIHELKEDGSVGAVLVRDQPLTQATADGDYVLDLTPFQAANKGNLNYASHPRLRTVIDVYRKPSNPDWPADVMGDLLWSGPGVQFSAQTRAPVSANSCLAGSYVQSGVFQASSSLQGVKAQTTARSNALVESMVANGLGPVMLESRYLGYTRANPERGEGLPTVAMAPAFDNNTFTGNLGFYDVTSGTPGAAAPVPLTDVHGLKDLTAGTRKVYTSLADGRTVPFEWTSLDDGFKDALDRNRSSIRDGLGQDRVAYLRGDRSKEIGRVGSNGVFHARRDRGAAGYASISSEIPDPGAMTGSGVALMLVGVLSGYTESTVYGYTNFLRKTRHPTTGRKLPVVFASSNDGFLYAHTVSGKGQSPGKLELKEVFTYLPRRPMSLMSGYTDRGFGQLGAFPYLNDGAPLLADVCLKDCTALTWDRADWRTTLVSGFGRAFPGGYALDVTNVTKAGVEPPVQSLWEFTDKTPVTTPAAQPDPARFLGRQSAFPLSAYSNASLSKQVVRLKVDGATRWAWIIGNGLGSPAAEAAAMSNDNATAVLYVVFMDGASGGHPQYIGIRLAGMAGKANGLSTPNPIDANGDGFADLVYAGDLQGNLWRIDLSNLSLAQGFGAQAAQVLMQAANGAGTVQPIVGAPAVVTIGNARRMIVFSSGRPEITTARYLDNADALYSLLAVQDAYVPGSSAATGSAAIARASCAVRTLGDASQVKVKIPTGPATYAEKPASVRPIRGTAMDKQQRCWALDLQPGESGIGNAAHNPIGSVVDLLSIESPVGKNRCTPGASWTNRLDALTGLPVGIDADGDGFVSAIERSYGGIKGGRSIEIIINNNGKDSSAGTDKTAIPPTGAGRVWWREL